MGLEPTTNGLLEPKPLLAPTRLQDSSTGNVSWTASLRVSWAFSSAESTCLREVIIANSLDLTIVHFAGISWTVPLSQSTTAETGSHARFRLN